MITLLFLTVGWDHRHEINSRQLLPFQTYKTDHLYGQHHEPAFYTFLIDGYHSLTRHYFSRINCIFYGTSICTKW